MAARTRVRRRKKARRREVTAEDMRGLVRKLGQHGVKVIAVTNNLRKAINEVFRNTRTKKPVIIVYNLFRDEVLVELPHGVLDTDFWRIQKELGLSYGVAGPLYKKRVTPSTILRFTDKLREMGRDVIVVVFPWKG